MLLLFNIQIWQLKFGSHMTTQIHIFPLSFLWDCFNRRFQEVGPVDCLTLSWWRQQYYSAIFLCDGVNRGLMWNLTCASHNFDRPWNSVGLFLMTHYDLFCNVAEEEHAPHLGLTWNHVLSGLAKCAAGVFATSPGDLYVSWWKYFLTFRGTHNVAHCTPV